MFEYQYRERVVAIVLAPILDFGRCPLASRKSAALWPIAGTPALTRLLVSLREQGIRDAVICAYPGGGLGDVACDVPEMRIRCLDEPLPLGNAGCIRDAAGEDEDALLLVLQAAVISPPRVAPLMRAHQQSGSHLTVWLGSASGDRRTGRTPELYVCNHKVIDYMPANGYFDIKEGLIPAMVGAGQSVTARILSHSTRGFRDRLSYLSRLGDWLDGDASAQLAAAGLLSESDNVLRAPGAMIHPDATLHGPVVVMTGARIEPGAVILGPTIIESHATIAAKAVVDSSAIWPNAVVGPESYISQSIIDENAVVPARATVCSNVVLGRQSGRIQTIDRSSVVAVEESDPERLPEHVGSGAAIDELK